MTQASSKSVLRQRTPLGMSSRGSSSAIIACRAVVRKLRAKPPSMTVV
jgi:hypothetical protein